MKTKISVRDAMTPRVITLSPSDKIVDAAKLMLKNEIGSIIILENGNPTGIVTEKDFTKLIAKEIKLHDITIKEIMSSPLVTISPNANLLDAARLMLKSKTRKLPVLDKGKLVGIITAEDIVRVAPKEIELLLELASIKSQEAQGMLEEFRQSPTEGECEICGNYSESLHEVGSVFVCPSCKEEMGEDEITEPEED